MTSRRKAGRSSDRPKKPWARAVETVAAETSRPSGTPDVLAAGGWRAELCEHVLVGLQALRTRITTRDPDGATRRGARKGGGPLRVIARLERDIEAMRAP